MQRPLGTVISTDDSPTTLKYAFVLDEGSPVKKGQFIQTTSVEGIVFGYVSEITRANRYFERAESVAEYERETPIATHFPIKSWEYAIAEVRVLGRMEKREEHYFQSRVSLPPSPGTKVIEADELLLKDFVGFVPDGLMLGKLQNHEVEAKIDMTRLLQKHLALLAMSGAGKCLEYNIPIKLENGTQKKIGEIADEAFKTGTIHIEDGVEVAIPKSAINVFSLNEEFKVSPNQVRAVTRRPSPNQLVKITTRSGREISLTPEHPLMILTSKGPIWKKAGEIKGNESIAVPRQLPFGDNNEVSLLDFYKNSLDMCVCDQKVLIELKKQLKGHPEVSRKIRYGLNKNSLPISDFWNLCKQTNSQSLFYKASKIKSKGSHTPIPSILKLDNDLGRFVGYLMGDGHVRKNWMMLAVMEPEVKQDFARLSRKLFGLKASLHKRSAICYSTALVRVLNDVFGVASSSGKKRVTNTLLSSNKDFLSGFLSGIFDTDGYISDKKAELEFCSKSKELAEGICNLLLKFGILARLYPKYNKEYQRFYFRVYAHGSNDLSIFKKNMRFRIKKKQMRLDGTPTLRSNSNIDLLPHLHPMLSFVLRKLRISQEEISRRAGVANNLSRYGKGEDALSRRTYKEILSALNSRKRELQEACLTIDSLQIPSCQLPSILEMCRNLKEEGELEYAQIGDACSASRATVRRMLCGETALTEFVLEIGKGTLHSTTAGNSNVLEEALTEYNEFSSIDINLLFTLADKVEGSYKSLDQYSKLWRGAWASYKRGAKRADVQSKICMLKGLKLAALEVENDLVACEEKLRLLSSLADSSILWDSVKHIEIIQSKEKYVYDIALEGNHNFIAGNLPIVVHNSYCVAVLIEELMKRRNEQGRIGIVVIDIHGEYGGFKHDPDYGRRVRVINGKDIAIPFRRLNSYMLSSWFSVPPAGQNELDKILREMRAQEKNERQLFSVNDLIKRVETGSINKNIKEALLRPLYELRSIRMISQSKEIPNLRKQVLPGEMLVIDLSDLEDMRKKKVIVSYIADRLFRLRAKGEIPPTFLLVEEAHNFAPEKAKAAHNPSKSIIEKIAREGRKFGLALGVVSQRPVNLSTTTLSQCSTHILLRVTNPNDLKHIEESAEGIDSRMARSITSLKVGEAIIVGEAVKYPIFVEVRKRKSKKVEKGRPLHEQAIIYESSAQKSEEEADEELEAFL